MTYDLFEHRHRFSAWAAARAAQRGLRNGTTEVCYHALKNEAKLTEFIRQHAGKPITCKEFDKLHREWCKSVVAYLKEQGVSAVTYGRAAKLVGVYLKCMVVIGPLAGTPLARFAHPPIDSNILDGLAEVPGISPKAKKIFLSTRWTKLDRKQYYDLVKIIRSEKELRDDIDPFWRLERYWLP